MMKEIYLEGQRKRIDKHLTMEILQCLPDSPVYEETEGIYQEVFSQAEASICPKGCIQFYKAEEIIPELKLEKETPVAVVLYTLGEEISRFSVQEFQRGDYLRGMLIDAMADSCLFTMEEEWKKILIKECRKRNLGIERRLEAPADIPMSVHKRVMSFTNTEKLGIQLSKGMMFFPIKTICLVFVLTEDICLQKVDHDCKACKNLKCRLRKIR